MVASYNERNVDGFAATLTSGLDQRKINSIYQTVQNPLTGKATLYLAKRPGIANSAQTSGSSGQTGYLIYCAPNATFVYIFNVSGNDVRVESTTIVTSAGAKPVYIDDTNISGQNYAVLQISTGRAFYASVGALGILGAFTEITDADFTALAGTMVGKAEHMDGFMFVLDSTNSVGRIFNSDLNSLANWTATNYITKQIQQDMPVGLAKFRNQILAFGNSSFEVFYNAGYATGSPLEAQKQLAGKIGLRAMASGGTHYYTVLDNALYFLGRHGQRSNFGAAYVSGLYAWDGSSMHKVSTESVDKILAAQSTYSVNTVLVRGLKAVAIQLDITTASTQRWLMYFPEWNDWFEWNSTVFTPVAHSGFHMGVGSNQHKFYGFDGDIWQDDGTDYSRVHQFKMPSTGKGNARNFMRWAGLEQDIERSACSELVEASDDDGQTWTTLGTLDCTSQKPHFYRGGSYRHRFIRLTNSSNHARRVENFLARVD